MKPPEKFNRLPLPTRTTGRARFLLACWLLFAAAAAEAAALVTADSPIGFFTNVASRLLKSELNLDLNHLQLYPTNQYTPAVHRLLQVTANLFDATTNRAAAGYPYPPSVFRPVFTNESGSIFIHSYVEETGTNFLTNTWRDISHPGARDALQANDNVVGVPLVIGAKKGFPNFNELSVQSVFQITRLLQLTRPDRYAPRSLWQTNQMYILGLSNVFGVEAWNSYTAVYPRDLGLIVSDAVTLTLSNDFGLQLTQALQLEASALIPANTWQGAGSSLARASLQVPFRTNNVFLPLSVYQHSPPGFTNYLPVPFEPTVGFPLPQWVFTGTHRFRFIMVDKETQRVVDFVNLDGPAEIRDLSAETADPDSGLGFYGLWSTNRLGDNNSVPLGILNQIMVCLDPSYDDAIWSSYGSVPSQQALTDFRNFFNRSSAYTNSVCEVPFSPSRLVVHYLTWQANDPLVHFLPNDLYSPSSGSSTYRQSLTAPITILKNIGQVNERYSPWGGNPLRPPTDPYSFDPARKDPRIAGSDYWDFPEGAPLSVALLGRVHRGTPWQTIYLKSAPVDLPSWQRWLGSWDDQQAWLAAPTNDWCLAGLLAAWLNTNSPQQLVSVNEPGTNAWLAAFDGISVLTNTSPNSWPHSAPEFETITMTAGSAQAALIASALQAAKASQPGGYFFGLGDILSTPQLSLASPWLNLGGQQTNWGITDAAYEAIPSQLLSRLRADSIGSVVRRGDSLQIQFTGFDDYQYAVEVSSNLVHWSPMSTHCPSNGVFNLTETPAPGPQPRFYRSVLLSQ